MTNFRIGKSQKISMKKRAWMKYDNQPNEI